MIIIIIILYEWEDMYIAIFGVITVTVYVPKVLKKLIEKLETKFTLIHKYVSNV